MIRPIAYKVWISDLTNASFINDENSNYALVRDKKVSRVNLIATVIRKYKSEDGNYHSIVIDDGFGSIRVKSWGEDTKLISEFDEGDLILFIGRVKNYNNETYLTSEILRRVEPDWEILRKLELINEYGKPAIKENIISNEVEEISESNENYRQNILERIEKHDAGDGVSVGEISRDMNHDKVMLFINELLKEGEIFEIKGKLKVV